MADNIKDAPERVLTYLIGHDATDKGGRQAASDYLKTATAASTYLTQANAASTYLAIADATEGTVQSIAVATANGFLGTSDGDPDNPEITIATDVTGILSGLAGAIVATPTITLANPGANWAGGPHYFIKSSGTASGTLTDTGINAAHVFNFGPDNVDATTAGGLYDLYAGMTVDGTSAKGNRVASVGVVSVSGTTGNTGTGFYYVASAGLAFASSNDNGASGAGNARGSLFGGNVSAELLSGATFWNEVAGLEVDVAARTGSSVAFKIGSQVVQLATDAVDGSTANYGYSLANQSGGSQPGWDFGFSVGAKNGVWPIKSTGTIIGADTTALGGPAYEAAKGIDWSGVTFSEAFVKSTGFVVTGTGALGVGINSSLQGNIHLHAASGNSIIRITNAATGSGNTDGLYFGQLAGLGALLINQEASSLVLGTNNATVLTLTSAGDLSLTDAADLTFGTTTGTKIGTAASQKLAFYNATPIVQQTGVAVTAGGIHAALVNLGLITA